MADFKAQQRVRLNNGTNDFGFAVGTPFFVKLSDGVDSLAIDTNGNISTVIRTPNGDSAMDETNDAVRVNIVAGSTSGTEFAEDAAHSSGDLGTLALVVRKDTPGSNVSADGDYASLLQDANGRLYCNIHDGGNSITVDGSVTVSATDLDIRDLTLATDAVRISGNSSANSELNPIFVQVVNTVTSGEEIHDYDTSASIASDATDNHDYTVAGTTFLLKSIIVAASGAMKCELRVGPLASLVTKAVIFTSASKPTEQIFFDPPIEVPSTSTGTIRIIRRNDDNQAMDVYSTIIGNDI